MPDTKVNLQKLKLIRKRLPMETPWKSHRAGSSSLILIMPTLCTQNYQNPTYLRKLHRFQNMTAKISTRVKKCDGSTTPLKTLDWLPVHLSIKHKVLTLVSRCTLGPNSRCTLGPKPCYLDMCPDSASTNAEPVSSFIP